MTANALRMARFGACLLALTCSIACGRSAEKAASPASPAEETADVDGAPAPGAAQAPAPAAEPLPAAESARDTGEASPRAPSIESNASPAAPEKKLVAGPQTNDDLRAATSAFDESLGANALSCDGARPHRDAICEIAKRLCELQVKAPSSTERDDCVTANQACEKAQRKYQARCGK
jgi:hypothetical protein